MIQRKTAESSPVIKKRSLLEPLLFTLYPIIGELIFFVKWRGLCYYDIKEEYEMEYDFRVLLNERELKQKDPGRRKNSYVICRCGKRFLQQSLQKSRVSVTG